jgi:hypothetical protein
LTRSLGILFLGILDPLLLALVEASQVFFSRIEIKIDFIYSGYILSLLGRWWKNTLLGPWLGEHDCVNTQQN